MLLLMQEGFMKYGGCVGLSAGEGISMDLKYSLEVFLSLLILYASKSKRLALQFVL
jgi:hypothetical protein